MSDPPNPIGDARHFGAPVAVSCSCGAAGGTTTLALDPEGGQPVDAARPSLAGTIRNCAGGETPWGTWLSAEETTEVNGAYRHGYVFEVPVDGSATGEPLRAMGRFSHEAVAIDLDSPDNICVNARGGMILCEDGSGREYLHGFTPDGRIFPFAENNVTLNGERGFHGDFSGSEWCGATFEPTNGNWLFVNIQSPGMTLAITGPWKQLGL